MPRKCRISNFFARRGISCDHLPDYVYEQAQQIIKRLESGAHFQSVNGKKILFDKNTFDKLPRDKKYHAVIKSEFITDLKQGFKVATAVIHPQGGPNPEAGEFLVQAHTCHPMQANDDGAGVVSTIELARRLAENPLPAGSMSVRFWFGPETIGTIAWLAHNENLIPNLRGGIFMEMTGNQNKIAWHHTRQHNHLLDRITNYATPTTTNATLPPRPPTMNASSTRT